MKKQFRLFYALLFLVFFLIIQSSFSSSMFESNENFVNISYKINPISKLEVFGKTNVNSFCCVSKEVFEPKELQYRFDKGKSISTFQKATFKIKVDQLDCGMKQINKDLHKSLKINEFPYIVVDLKEILNLKYNEFNQCDSWVECDANTDITITCKTQTVRFPIRVKKLDSKSYRIKGSTALQLCDFDIEAPTAMLGMIKVDDTIELNFDLYINAPL